MPTQRSTKRQKELLLFVDTFIKLHGYGPSYREIMNGMGYKSVSTVAIHIDGLITRGYLRKRDNSARSLEVLSSEYVAGGRVGDTVSGAGGPAASVKNAAREKWLVSEVETRFAGYDGRRNQQALDELYVLVGALKVLGFENAYIAMRAKLADIIR